MTSSENPAGAQLSADAFPGEVVTRAIVRDVDLGPGAGVLALITLDNGHDHAKPNTFGPQGLLSLNAALNAVAARAAAGEIAAAGVTGKPFILAAGAGPGRRGRGSRRRGRGPARRAGSGRSASPRSATRSSGGSASCRVPSFSVHQRRRARRRS